MGPFFFAVLWTTLSAALIIPNLGDLAPWERAAALLFPLFGLMLVHITWRWWRRRRSLRVEEAGGTTWYVWIEVDGNPRRSTRDPREEWDSADGDGDGGD